MSPRGGAAFAPRLRRRSLSADPREVNVLSRDDRLLDELGRRRLICEPVDPVIRLLAALVEDADRGGPA